MKYCEKIWKAYLKWIKSGKRDKMRTVLVKDVEEEERWCYNSSKKISKGVLKCKLILKD